MLTTFLFLETKAFCGDIGERRRKSILVFQSLLLFSLNTHINDKMSSKFAFMTHFDITHSIYNVDLVLNCLCLRWAMGDECENIFTQTYKLIKILTKWNGMLLDLLFL